MKRLMIIAAAFALLTACASTSQSATSSDLPPGKYTLKGFNAEGEKRGGTVKIVVPYDNPSFAVGVLCANSGTVVVKAVDDAGREATFKCIVNGKPAS